ncbi:MAG: xanthine dehydrogenase family protein molybdopterin-binding subunit [Ectothiorhodospiraceae bacterium]|nr:xanthine dehydrogenase family protein molybdopterin-binding subunit [Ectothiorhodospiraceae bacterium]
MSTRAGRVEDARLLTGRGTFVDDVPCPDAAWLHVVRSPHAHARIQAVDTAHARGVAGVLAVYTGADLQAAGLGPLPCVVDVRSSDGSPARGPQRLVLATEVVRHVGDPVAAVVARTPEAAREAAERVECEYAPLAAEIDLAAAGVVAFDWEKGDADAVDRAFAAAARVVTMPVVNNRIAISPIEARSALAVPEGGRLVLHTQTQGVHLVRRVLARDVLGIDEATLRVVTPDVGGSFGMKIYPYPEQALVLHAARDLGRPVRWSSDRGEAFLSDAHGRGHVATASIALDRDGRFLAARADIRADLGAYLSTLGPMIPTEALARTFGTVYRIPALHLRVRGILTNTTPIDAYRGAGKPESTYLLERLVERAARESGIDAITLRRRNLLRPEALPYRTPMGYVWDAGDFERALDTALEAADWSGFPARRAASARRGMRRGIGLGMYLHATGGSTTEVSTVALTADGLVEVRTGTQAAGQGHETAFAEVVARRLEIPADRVRVVQGDSDRIASGGGTGGSSSLTIGATTIDRAAGVMLEQARDIAGERLEAAPADLEYGAGAFRVRGTDLRVGLLELVVEGPDSGEPPSCVGEAAFEGENLSCPNGAYVCEVEVDPDTGAVRIERFTAVDDLGRVLVPAIAEGQIHGGIAQAIGQALTEEMVYDPETGQPLSGSFMDYCLPRADDIPAFTTRTIGSPTANNHLGMKGAGEVGPIGGCAPVVHAVADAIGHDRLDMPLTPMRVWQAMRDG